MVGGGWCPTFWFFKSLDINMVYTLDIGVYIYIYIYLCRTNFLWVLFFHEVEEIFNYFQNHTARMIFQKNVSNFLILRRELEQNFEVFMTFVWIDF